jgi:Icc-related predicted phosphoesterase
MVRATRRDGAVRLAAVGDLHCREETRGHLQSLFARMAEDGDVILLCGDLTNSGTPEEAQTLAGELNAASQTPVVAVLGNHDYESGKQQEIRRILAQSGVRVLDGDECEFFGVGFAGTKGFFGGFGERMLQAWGEGTTKQIVHEAMEEALKLESALARLKTPRRVVVLHYSPIAATVQGEPKEIFPFLGSSRLEEPIHRHPVAAVFHGHAHYGAAEGQTTDHVPVFNVALPLLRRLHPDRPPYRSLEIPIKADHVR